MCHRFTRFLLLGLFFFACPTPKAFSQFCSSSGFDLSTFPPPPVLRLTESVCNGTTTTNGSLVALPPPTGLTVEYLVEGIWSTTVPVYNQEQSITIQSRYFCNADPTIKGNIDFPLITNPAPCKLIPTMNQWGLLIFGLLILNLGIVFIYKKEY